MTEPAIVLARRTPFTLAVETAIVQIQAAGGNVGTIGGTIAAGQVAVGSGADAIGGSAKLTWDGVNNTLIKGAAATTLLAAGLGIGYGFVLADEENGGIGLMVAGLTGDSYPTISTLGYSGSAAAPGNVVGSGIIVSQLNALVWSSVAGDKMQLGTLEFLFDSYELDGSVDGSVGLSVGGSDNYLELHLSSTLRALVTHTNSAQIDLGTSSKPFLIGYFGTSVVTPMLEGAEIATPSAPADGSGRVYFKEATAGKTGLYVLFPSGAEQQIKVEA